MAKKKKGREKDIDLSSLDPDKRELYRACERWLDSARNRRKNRWIDVVIAWLIVFKKDHNMPSPLDFTDRERWERYEFIPTVPQRKFVYAVMNRLEQLMGDGY